VLPGVLPGNPRSLWHMLWANVPQGTPPEMADLKLVFPWLAPTQTSGDGRTVMPRRIRLDFEPCDPAIPCDLTGTPDTVRVTSWRQRPQGVNYALWGDLHPLTPRYRVKPGTEILSLHPQPGGIGYRHWLGLVVADTAGLRFPAPAVITWREGRDRDSGAAPLSQHRLLAAGYDMDNMKARGFVESEMPLPAIPDAAVRQRVDALARDLVQAADTVASLLRRAVRNALFGEGATVKLDWELLSVVREQLWDGTEAAFYEALALELFDIAAPLAADGGSLPKSDDGIRRLLKARRDLGLSLHGYRKDGLALMGILGLPAPEAKPRKTKAATKGRVT